MIKLYDLGDVDGLAELRDEMSERMLFMLAEAGNARATRVFVDRRDVGQLKALADQPQARDALVDLAKAGDAGAINALKVLNDTAGLVEAAQAGVHAARNAVFDLAVFDNKDAKDALPALFGRNDERSDQDAGEPGDEDDEESNEAL